MDEEAQMETDPGKKSDQGGASGGTQPEEHKPAEPQTNEQEKQGIEEK